MDFSETFAPVAKLDTIRLLLIVAVQKSWKVFQLDVKYAFWNGYLKEEIFSLSMPCLLAISQEVKKLIAKNT